MRKLKGIALILWIMTSQVVLSQDTMLYLEVSPGENLQEIVSRLSTRNQFLIAYPAQLAELKPSISGHLSATNISDLLGQLFQSKIQIKEISPQRLLLRDGQSNNNTQDQSSMISGKVTNVQGQSISDMLIYQEGGSSVFSDEDGKFDLPLNHINQEQPIIFQSIGYATHQVMPSKVKTDPTILIKEDPVTLDMITIVDRLPSIRSDINSLVLHTRANQSRSMLSSLSATDLIKKVQLLPGVQAHDDLSSEIKIRGSSGNESLIILDGIPLYKVDHFYGIFSSINAQYVNDVVLYKNALPIQFGGKTGGMLNMSSPSEVKHFSGNLEVDLLSASLSFSSPIAKNLSLAFSGRTSFINAANSSAFDLTGGNVSNYLEDTRGISRNQILTTEPIFDFSDLNARVLFTPSAKWHIDANLFYGTDDFENNYDLQFLSRLSRVPTRNQETFSSTESWKNVGASINSQLKINDHWDLQLNTYVTSYENLASTKSLLTVNTASNQLNFSLSNQQHSVMDSKGGYLYLSRKSKDQIFKVGMEAKSYLIKYDFNEDSNTILVGQNTANEITFFTENTWDINKFSVVAGARTTFYNLTSRWYLDPKIELKYRVSPFITLKSSAHFAHQFMRELNYESRLAQTWSYPILAEGARYPIGSSLQVMAGLVAKGRSWNIDVEFYRKSLDGVIDLALRNPGFSENFGLNSNRSYQIYRGTGDVIGLDILFEQRLKQYTTWVAYTLSKSTEQFIGIKGNQAFPTQDDRRHQFKWINSYRKGSFTFSANYVFSSGKPYLSLPELKAGADRNTFTKTAFKMLPSYQRIDLGIDYSFSIFHKKALIGLSCFNLANRNNVKYLQYIFAVPNSTNAGAAANTIIGTETSMLGRTPILRFQIAL